jgi:hypothetical protein
MNPHMRSMEWHAPLTESTNAAAGEGLCGALVENPPGGFSLPSGAEPTLNKIPSKTDAAMWAQ